MTHPDDGPDGIDYLDFEAEDEDAFPNLAVIHRRVLFDIAVNGKELAEGVGLPPISDEQATMERAASTARLAAIQSLTLALEDHSAFVSAVFIAIQKEAARREGRDMPDELWSQAYDQLHNMLRTTTKSAVALLVDLNRLSVVPDETSEQAHDGK